MAKVLRSIRAKKKSQKDYIDLAEGLKSKSVKLIISKTIAAAVVFY